MKDELKPGEKGKSVQQPISFKYISVSFIVILLLSFLFIAFQHRSLEAKSNALFWMISCILSGGTVGFLFGIPKVVQGNKPVGNDGNELNDGQDYRMHINSNLTEISDWLTKIIVGLGLVNLGSMPEHLYPIAMSLARGIGAERPDSALALSYALITGCTILGFLFGYLATRLELTKAFVAADQSITALIKSIKEQLEMQIASIESKQQVLSHVVLPKFVQSSSEEVDQNRATDAINELIADADAYLKIETPDWAGRTQEKDEVASKMAALASLNGISKTDILNEYKRTSNQGLFLAYATMINLRPSADDLPVLLQEADKISRKHVQYRVLLAIESLFKAKFLTAEYIDAAKKLAQSYLKNADEPLTRRIKATLDILAG